MSCPQSIGFSEHIARAGWEGRGFGRRYIVTHRCPACGAVHRRIVSARRGKQPDLSVPGGFRCGMTTEPPVSPLAQALADLAARIRGD